MNDDRIKELLTQADATAGPASYSSVSAAGIRSRAGQRRIRFVAFPATAAALLLLGVGLWNWRSQPPASTPEPGERIASLEEQIRQLQIQSAETLQLVREVVAAERGQRRLVALEAELASIGDPLEELRRQANETAYILLCQGDSFYHEMNQPQSAIDSYEQVIRVFPESPWADEARDRLAQIRTHRTNRT